MTNQNDDNKENIESMNESMKLKSEFKDPVIDDLDKLEKKIDEVNKNITSGSKMIRPPLTNQEKIDMLNMIFPIQLGSKVRNKHSEDGIVETVAIDRRGVIYFVEYKEQRSKWESEDQIRKIAQYGEDDKVPPGPLPFRTDIKENTKKEFPNTEDIPDD
jgi:hypothetical protein